VLLFYIKKTEKMKKMMNCVLLVLASTLAFSQVDTKSKPILDNLKNKLNSYQTMKIDFTFIIDNKESNSKESKNGTIYIKGEKYKLEIAGQTIFCDGSTTWNYIKESNEVQINTVQPSDDAMIPTKMISSWEKNFKAKYIKESVEGGKTIQVVDLTPLKTKNFFKVRLNINKDKSQLESSIVYAKNGGTNTYKINNFITNTPMNDAIFTFKASDYPGVEINDLR